MTPVLRTRIVALGSLSHIEPNIVGSAAAQPARALLRHACIHIMFMVAQLTSAYRPSPYVNGLEPFL